MRVLVTGGAGFIGSHLVEALRDRGDEVVVLDDLSTGKRANLPVDEGVTLVRGDVRSEEDVEAAFGKGPFDGVLHQAALPSVERSVQDPVSSLDVNVLGTTRILEAARTAGVRHLVYASSSSVYGDTEILPKEEEMRPDPRSPYAVSKLSGEQMVVAYAALHGMATVALRYFNVFGPRQDPDSPYAAAIPKFVTALRQDEPPTIFGDGEQTRDFTYVANAVQANLRALEAPEGAWGGVYNVGCGERISINELVKELRAIVGGPSPQHGPPRPGDVRHSLASIDAAREAIGYEPEVSLQEGLRRTARSFD